MDSLSKHNNGHQNLYTFLRTQQEINNKTSEIQSIMHSSNSDFPIAVAVLAIMAVALLLASYYIFVIKCCLNWQHLDPLRRFPISRRRRDDDDPLMSFSPMVNMHRGLDEWLISNLPAFQYKGKIAHISTLGSRSFRGCSVCLSDFHEKEMLRVLPRCNHIFHLDCIDIWLLNNASCPLCRSSISGRTKCPIDQIIAPSSSPIQELMINSPYNSGNLSININGDDQDYLVIELGDNEEIIARNFSRDFSNNNNSLISCKKTRKLMQHGSIMGDECINIRQKDEQFSIQQPIRRSFSMDSVVDRGLYLQVRDIVRRSEQDKRLVTNNNEVSSSSSSVCEECNSGSVSGSGRVRRSSFFSFRHYGRGSSRSSSSILPIINSDQIR